MKEITRKSKLYSNIFPKSINVSGKVIKKNSHNAEEVNKYFTIIGPNLANKIHNASKTFEDFLIPVEKNMEYRDLTFGELKKSVKRNKAETTEMSQSKFVMKLVSHYFLFFTVHLVKSFFQSS